ncbi:transposon Tf2-9 polyprotein [Nephila pilipes]|uniref:Transposon Tf2-9 polyprotein n=1 Tax=Nephila pilipes TaxID=299642 RepID=A0A8X6R604_NEPPI|nr:transposon Tf2-9 polyprotein [Nephila pilipes]
MEAFRPPAPLQFSLGNVKDKWRQEFENYLLTTEKNERADKIKIAILLNLLGASTCEFAEQENGLIRDRIILGINKDSGLQERLLRENNLSLEKAIEIVRAAEASWEQIPNMKYETATINFVKKKENPIQPKKLSQYECKKCGRKHKPRECPAFGQNCTKCNKKNHFAVKCFQNAKNIHEMNVPENELDVYLDSVTVNETKCDMISFTIDKNIEMVSDKSITLDVNHKCFDVNFKLDTGAEVNILPLYILNMFKVKPKLSETNLSLTTYGNFKLKPDGSLIINCSTNKLKNVPLPFYVVNVKSKPILGLKGCKELKLIERIDAIECSIISKNELIKQYKDVFTGIGEFPSEPYHITLKDNSVSVIHPPRRLPQTLEPKLKKKPNGNLRLCLDPRDLNKVIKREHYQIPCTDYIISRLEGKKIFSVVDLKDGFWHVPLDEVSSEIRTFNTPFGRYKFNKLPFGIVSAPEVFQKRNQKLFGDIEGVEIYFDDIIVAGYNEDLHHAIMSKVLEIARSGVAKVVYIDP